MNEQLQYPPAIDKPMDAIEAEQAIVGAAAFVGADALAIIDETMIAPGDYANPDTEKALSLIRGIVDDGGDCSDMLAIDTVSKKRFDKEEGRRLAALIRSCYDTVVSEITALKNLPIHLKAVKEAAERRRLAESADAMKEAAMSGDMDGAVAIAAAVGKREADEPAPDAEAILRPFPRELLHVDGGGGIFDTFAAHAYAAFPMPNLVCNFFAGVAVVSALAGKKYRAQWGSGERTYPHEYFLMLADTAAGKDAGRAIIKELFAAENLPGRMDAIGSGEGVIDTLFATGGVGLLMTDEIGFLLKALAQDKQNPLSSLQPILLTLFSCGNNGQQYDKRVLSRRGQAAAGDDTPATIVPSLTMYGTATPGQFYDNVTLPMFESGFVGRCLIIPGDFDGELHDATRAPKDLPEELRAFARHCAGIDPGAPVIVTRDASAAGLAQVIRNERMELRRAAKLAGDRLGIGLWGRYHEHAEKLALLAAIARNYRAPAIDTACVNWGASVAKWVIEYTMKQYYERQAGAGGTWLDAVAERILSKVPEGASITAQELHRKCGYLKEKYAVGREYLIASKRLRRISQGTPGKAGCVTAYARARPPIR